MSVRTVSLGGSGYSGVLPATRDEALAAAGALARELPLPGSGGTLELWEALASVASVDLGAVRALEPHVDTVAILDQAGQTALLQPDSTWGVFAAEGGNEPVTATLVDGGWTLSGVKPWCSLADRLSNALISATTTEGDRRLFAISLASVTVEEGAWHSRGLAEIPSGPIRLDAVAATPVGDAGWYLTRPGFAWGGIGVAACWFGGAVGIARSVFASVKADNPLALMHLGAIDELVQSGRRALAEAAALIDAGTDDRLLARRVRGTVAKAAEEIITRSGHALGPAPLALDDEHAKRVADLTIYIRQHHAEKDDASLGSALLKKDVSPW